MIGYGVRVKKLYDGSKNVRMADTVRYLVQEFKNFDLNPADWREVYLALLRHLTTLNERYKLLAVIYRAVSLRSDYTTASKVVYKMLKNFDILFEKLPGRPSYFIPTPAGMWLFEQLIEPEKRAEVHEAARIQSTVVQQLSLMSYLARFKGVRA